MLHYIQDGAAAPGDRPPLESTTLAVAGPALLGTEGTGGQQDSGSARRNGQPFRYAQGEAEALDYLVRWRMRLTRRDELALIVASTAPFPKLRGFCARIESALKDRTDDAKAVAAQTARATPGGVQVYRLTSGGLLLRRWNLSAELPDLAFVAALLDRMGVAP